MATTIHTILDTARQVALGAHGLPLGDPRITLALELILSGLSVVQALETRGVFSASTPIELDDIGLALYQNMQAQWEELGLQPQGRGQ